MDPLEETLGYQWRSQKFWRGGVGNHPIHPPGYATGVDPWYLVTSRAWNRFEFCMNYNRLESTFLQKIRVGFKISLLHVEPRTRYALKVYEQNVPTFPGCQINRLSVQNYPLYKEIMISIILSWVSIVPSSHYTISLHRFQQLIILRAHKPSKLP